MTPLFMIDVLRVNDLCEVDNMPCLYMGRGDVVLTGAEPRYELFLTHRGDIIYFEPDFMDLRVIQRI